VVEAIFADDGKEHAQVIGQYGLFTVRVHMPHELAIYHDFFEG
jgi:hypothetical protein